MRSACRPDLPRRSRIRLGRAGIGSFSCTIARTSASFSSTSLVVIVESHHLLEDLERFARLAVLVIERRELVVAVDALARELRVADRLLQLRDREGGLPARCEEVAQDRRGGTEVRILGLHLLEHRDRLFVHALAMEALTGAQEVTGLLEQLGLARRLPGEREALGSPP